MVAEHGIPPPQERIPERTCEQVVDVRVPQVVEQVLDVPKNSSQDRNLQGTLEQNPDDPVLEMVEQLMNLPKAVSEDGIQRRTAERIAGIPVPQVVEGLVEVSKVFSQDRVQQRFGVQTIETLLFHSQRRSLRCLSIRRASLMPETTRSPGKIWS